MMFIDPSEEPYKWMEITLQTHLQKSGDLKVRGLAFSSFFHVPENGRLQEKIAPESGQKDHLFYWLQFAIS